MTAPIGPSDAVDKYARINPTTVPPEDRARGVMEACERLEQLGEWESYEVATFCCVDCYTKVTTSEAEGVSTVGCPMCSAPAHRTSTENRTRLVSP